MFVYIYIFELRLQFRNTLLQALSDATSVVQHIYIYIELNCLFKHQYSGCPLWCIIITKNNKNKRIENTK